LTPEYIASRLSLLPQFEVAMIHRAGKQGVSARLEGYFSEVIPAGEQGANLFLYDLRYMEGLLVATGEPGLARSVEVGEYAWADILEHEILGTHLAFFGNYDRRRLNLVIKTAIVWTIEDFKPRPALESYVVGTDGKPYRKTQEYRRGMAIPDGSRVVESEWDHEHCIFCGIE
jgi:hypothetical protein